MSLKYKINRFLNINLDPLIIEREVQEKVSYYPNGAIYIFKRNLIEKEQ